MVGREELPIVFEGRPANLTFRECSRRSIDGHLALEARIFCTVRLTHAANAERRKKLKLAEAGPRLHLQVSLINE